MPILNLYKQSSSLKLQLFLSSVGMLVACWVMYIQQGWINDDSVLYFEAARLFASGEWDAGLSLFPWPLYSLLIAGVHYITGFSLHSSAQILNAVFIFISFYGLLRIITLASGDKFTLIIATTLLLASSYIFGDVVGMLLRDEGFWAFMLIALGFFIKFHRDGQLKDAIYWQLFAIIAMLFRIEAFTYIALLPFVLLIKPETKTLKKIELLLKAHLLNISASVLIVIAMFMNGSIHLTDLGRIKEIFSAFSDIESNFTSHIMKKIDVMGSTVLGQHLEGFALTGFLFTLFLVVITKSMSVAGWLPAILIIINHSNIKLLHDVNRILWVTATVAIINGILIILKVNLLSSRYVILFGLILIIFASFSARSLADRWQHKQLSLNTRFIAGLAIASLIITFVLNVLPKSEGYNYQKVATDYVRSINKEGKKVFYVSPRARFYAGVAYAGRENDYWEFTRNAILDGSIYEYDYLVINLDLNENTATREALLKENLSNYVLIKTVHGHNKKKRMLIYKKN